MRKRNVVTNFAVMLAISIPVFKGLELFNTWFNVRCEELFFCSFGSMHHMFFAEGLLFILFGSMLLLGSSGINLWTVSSILDSSVADWIYGKDLEEEYVRPSEFFHADRWRSEGFPFIGLTCVFIGIILLLSYFYNFFILGW